MRIFLQYILPLAFPTAIYLLWVLYQRKKSPDDHGIELRDSPWIKLLGIGVLLMAAFLVAFNLMDGEKPGGTYHPPVLKDGKIIPGHIERNE